MAKNSATKTKATIKRKTSTSKTKTTAKKTTKTKAKTTKKSTSTKKKQTTTSKKTPIVAKTTTTKKKSLLKNVKLMDLSSLKRKPFDYQVIGAEFLLNTKKAILGDDMGLGKSFQTILSMSSIKGKRLLVCPASLKLNWQKEIRIVSNDEINIIDGQKWIKPSRNSWTIINYDILHNHMDEIKKSNFAVASFDEVHFCKGINSKGRPSSKRARYFLQICNLVDYAFLLTGTPITNKTKDIFNLLKAMKHPLSKDFKAFAQRYCDPEFNGFGYSYEGSSNQEELNELLKPFMLRRLKEDVLDLPNKIRTFIPVDVDIKSYMSKVNEYMSKKGELKHRGEHLVYFNAMRHILAKEKVEHTIKMAENLLEQGRPVVVFTNYTYVVEEFKKRFKSAVTITGKVSKKDRDLAVEKFQNGETDIIVCNLVAGGVGLTLTRAKNMLINDFDWIPANHTQAEDRIFRIGQDENVLIEYVYSQETVDEKMAGTLETKLKNINKIIDDKDEGFLDEIIDWFGKKEIKNP